MVLDESVDHLVRLVGHDGSEIIWPSLPEPFCRRGHHIEELQYAALDLGISLAPFVPQFEYNPGARETLPFERYDFTKQFSRVKSCYDGILLGEYTKGHPHAVAWNANEGLIYDPDGGCHPDSAFRAECFYAAIVRA
jgi:hypothetical protein